MDKTEILKNIKNGNYKVEYEEDCYCNIQWEIKGDDLNCDIDGNCCYQSNNLIVDGEIVLRYIRYDGFQEEGSISIDDIQELNDGGDILQSLKLSDMPVRGESGNSKMHDDNVREALIGFLMENNYKLGRDDERGFANEYTSTLQELGEGEIIEISREEAEQWADEYLYAGDAATEAFNGFKLLPAE